MSDLKKASVSLHPNGLSGDFRSEDGLAGLFIFATLSAKKGAAVSTTEMVGEVTRDDEGEYSFSIKGWPKFRLRVERTASGRIPLPPSYPTEPMGPMGC